MPGEHVGAEGPVGPVLDTSAPPDHAKKVADLKPDLLLTQELCHVCAVAYPGVLEAARLAGGGSKPIWRTRGSEAGSWSRPWRSG